MKHVSANGRGTGVCGLAGLAAAAMLLSGCACGTCAERGDDSSAEVLDAEQAADEASSSAEPPPHIRAWMDRLTVPHAYDPETGFIVARGVIPLPPLLAEAPPLEEQAARSVAEDRLLIVFATADRCAPCQQFKQDALNNRAVLTRLERGDVLVAHVEVDRERQAAERVLGSAGIPVTYALRGGEVVGTLPGQRSAADVLAFIERSAG